MLEVDRMTSELASGFECRCRRPLSVWLPGYVDGPVGRRRSVHLQCAVESLRPSPSSARLPHLIIVTYICICPNIVYCTKRAADTHTIKNYIKQNGITQHEQML